MCLYIIITKHLLNNYKNNIRVFYLLYYSV
jgi:hypothetical protein